MEPGLEERGTGAHELVPARMVNEFVYCPRLAYLEWVQSEFAANVDVAEGRYRHRAVAEDSGSLPSPLALEKADHIHARSVWLSAPQERLTARMDLLEGEGLRVTPVDYKRGAVPDLPLRAWEADRVQVCAQGLVLIANGYAAEGGVIYYCASKTRVAVRFDADLIAQTRQAVQELLEMAEAATMPPPLVDSPKCVRCSLAGICLPDEINLLTGKEVADDDGLRRILPARDEALPLYVQEQGARIAKHGEVLEIQHEGRKVGEARLFETSQVSIFGNVQITTQALHELCNQNIPVTFFSTGGWFYGLAHGLCHKNVELRMAQYRIAEDRSRSLLIAREMIAAKISNCRTFLMRNHTHLDAALSSKLLRLSENARSSKDMQALLGLEGLAAKTYFSAFSGMLKGGSPEGCPFDFTTRNRRPPHDPINALLSYAYSLLVKDLTVTLLAVGFDPFLGFYHQPRYGRPSLALDLMEEFRPIIADSVVLWVVNNGVIGGADFINRGPAVAIKPDARRRLILAYEKRLDALVTHPIFGYRISYRRVLEVQARLLGRVLSGEVSAYPGFKTR